MSTGIGYHVQNLAILIQFFAMCVTTWRAWRGNWREWGCPPRWLWRAWFERATWRRLFNVHDRQWRRDFSTTTVLVLFTYFRWYRLQLRMSGGAADNWWLFAIDLGTTAALLWMLWEHREGRRLSMVGG